MINEFVNIDKRRPSIVSANLDDFSPPKRRESHYAPATFEEAISAAGLGKFNVFLVLVSMMASLTISFDTGSMSYASLVAECDLNLTLSDKGVINAVVFAGMVSSATVWGILSDQLGRKKILIFGLLGDFLAGFLSFLSQNLTVLIIAKYFQGFMVIGPFATINAYLAEFQMTKHRSKFLLALGYSNTLGTLLLPIFAFILLPMNLDFRIWDLEFHAWNVYLLIAGLPALTSGLCLVFFPESPKFLMSKGRNEEALKVFRTVYRINTGKPADTYPIKKLLNETISQPKTNITQNGTQDKQNNKNNGWEQVKPLFHAPHLNKLILVCLVTLGITSCLNMLRLWIPQIFQAIAKYQTLHNGTSSTLCTMIEGFGQNGTTGDCKGVVDASVYYNTMIISGTSLLNYIVAIIIIPWFGKKRLVCCAMTGAGLAVFSIYFARDPPSVLASAALFQAWAALCGNLIVSISVDLFPTSLRTLAISTGVLMGRFGSMGGNFLFPFLLTLGCEPPFFFVGSIVLAAAVLTLFFPKTDEQSLQ